MYTAAVTAFVAWTGFAFGLGMMVNMEPVKSNVCPQVVGGQVLKTINTGQEQMCIFIKETSPAGQKKVTVKI